jgi:hypothetical protein
MAVAAVVDDRVGLDNGFASVGANANASWRWTKQQQEATR